MNGGFSRIRLTVRQTLAIACRILTEYVRQRRSLIFWAVFPALMPLLFGLIYRNNALPHAGFDTTAAGILIGAALFFSCLGGTVSLIVAERERRTLRRLLVSPLHPAAYVLGLVLALSVIAFGQAVIVYTLANAMGAHYHASVWLGVLIVALSVFAYVGLGFFFGARFARRAEDVNGPVAAFGVPLLVLAGTFFPVTLLPEFLLKVAYLDPVFHMNEALKAVAARCRLGRDLRTPELPRCFRRRRVDARHPLVSPPAGRGEARVSLVRFDRIRKSFADKLVLDDLSLAVHSGEVCGCPPGG